MKCVDKLTLNTTLNIFFLLNLERSVTSPVNARDQCGITDNNIGMNERYRKFKYRIRVFKYVMKFKIRILFLF